MSHPDLSRRGIEPIVLVNGALDEHLKVLSIFRSAGGRRVDTCHLYRDMGYRPDDRAMDFHLDASVNAEIEVHAYPRGIQRVLFWGKIVRTQLEWGASERKVYISQVPPHLFGEPLQNTTSLPPRLRIFVSITGIVFLIQ